MEPAMTDAAPIVVDNPAKHRFEVTIGDHRAVAEYRLSDGAIMFTHTEVPKELEGQGLGGALIRAGLAAARERGLKVQPVCSFFAAYIKRHPETHDLLDPAYAKILDD
jgi:predicted GNAT family acetyltransferase